MQAEADWQPTASLDALKLRATVLARLRGFFAARNVLEVDTPVLSVAGTPDPALHSFQTRWHGPGTLNGTSFYLHTSPEFPMKRLLAAGAGSIYQVCKVFRDGESGRHHNPEFTLLEWYRTGFDYFDLMDEVEVLLREVLEGLVPLDSVDHWTYRDLFVETAGIDPFTVTVAGLGSQLQARGISPPAGLAADDHDGWLDMVLTHVVEPAMPAGLVFVRDYPASQAALARLRPGTPPVAARFEVYLNGIELANGFHELTDADEQRQRFAQENDRRQQQGDDAITTDERLLAALEAGVPDCAGVALGIDRLLMIAGQYGSLDDVIAFPLERA
ncbi:MAG: EF-P lysine aminoacylase EpmA [Pseudomonadota bacterium]